MARIRTIKPEFWADEKLGPLDPLTRLVFLGLVSLADDAGRLVDSVRQLDGLLFPYTSDSCDDALETLARLSRVRRYTSESGQQILQVEGWADHQKVDRPSRYVLPSPPERNGVVEPSQAVSRDTRETLARHSRDTRAPILDLGSRTLDPGPGSVEPHARDGSERAFGKLDNIAIRSIKGLYGWAGTEGTDERVWNGTAEPDRVRCVSIAIARLEGESKAYNGKLFRRILESVIAEQAARPGANGTSSQSPTAAEEAATHEQRRRRERKHDAHLERMNAEGAELLERATTAKQWLDDQDEKTQSAVVAMMLPGLRRLGITDPRRASLALIAQPLVSCVDTYRAKLVGT